MLRRSVGQNGVNLTRMGGLGALAIQSSVSPIDVKITPSSVLFVVLRRYGFSTSANILVSPVPAGSVQLVGIMCAVSGPFDGARAPLRGIDLNIFFKYFNGKYKNLRQTQDYIEQINFCNYLM